jgi:hypothetical protein
MPNFLGMKICPPQPHYSPIASWEVVEGTQTIGEPAGFGGKSNGENLNKRFLKTASPIPLNSHKLILADQLMLLSYPGTPTAVNAQKKIILELNTLDIKQQRLIEKYIWEMIITGALSISTPNYSVTVDYGLPASHKITVGVNWTDALCTPALDVEAAKQLIVEDSGVEANVAFCNATTMAVIYNYVTNIFAILSDQQKQEFTSTSKIKNLWDLDWTTYRLGYKTTDAGAYTKFIPDGYIVIMSTDFNPIHLADCLVPDTKCPEMTPGRFAKTWDEEDPSGKMMNLKHPCIPVAERPTNWVVLKVF